MILLAIVAGLISSYYLAVIYVRQFMVIFITHRFAFGGHILHSMTDSKADIVMSYWAARNASRVIKHS